jgi:hypothetical protein
MKRSSARRARRWVLQELTRWLEQHKDFLLDQTRSIGGHRLGQAAARVW